MQQPNYVLENNRTPATHFIEVWRDRGLNNLETAKDADNAVIYGSLIDSLADQISDTTKCGFTTIAIFKIHPKCN